MLGKNCRGSGGGGGGVGGLDALFHVLTAFSLSSKSVLTFVFTLYLLLILLLKKIFSVQNSNLMYSVDFLPDLVQIQMRESVSGFFWQEWTSQPKCGT